MAKPKSKDQPIARIRTGKRDSQLVVVARPHDHLDDAATACRRAIEIADRLVAEHDA